MSLHLAARVHAFVHGLFQPDDEAETRELHRKVKGLFDRYDLGEETGRARFIRSLAVEVLAAFELPSDHPQIIPVTSLIEDIFDYENLFILPGIERPPKHSVAEHWTLREGLNAQRRLVEGFGETAVAFRSTLVACLDPIYFSCPPLVDVDDAEHGVTFSVNLFEGFPNSGLVVENIIAPFFDEAVERVDLFSEHRERLSTNLIVASGGDPAQPQRFNRAVKPPSASQISDPAEIIESYLGGTPICAFLQQDMAFTIPQESRFEHCHIIGGTGHGKTQLLQRLIHHDLQAAQDETMSMIVIDSQGDLIRKLSALKVFDPTDSGSLTDRFLLVDPADIDHPPALNLFDPGLRRMAEYTPYQRELAFNSLVDIYGRFFGALLGSELTARQGAVFRYLARLMLTIEGATIHTLIELMDDVGPFKDHIAKLDPTARRFFEKEFARKTFNATRAQIKQRLYAVLSIPTFDRLFSAPKSKIDFFDALNDGKIVLVNTAKDLLKADGAEIFGRFILSLIEHAIMERATLPEAERTPTFLYVDEAQDYFDETIETLLVQGRKFNFGLTLAHQNLAQLSPRLRAVIMGNTTVKLAGGVSHDDARALAADMRTTADNLMSMRKRGGVSEFALSVRNLTPHALKTEVMFGLLESEPVLDSAQRKALLERNRERVGYEPLTEEADPSSTGDPSQEKADRNHAGIQQVLANRAKAHGFGAEIEHALSDGRRIDLALFGHGLSIAIEVSITNRKDYELSNIEKALAANFDQVWMIADDPDHREKIASHARRSLRPNILARVTFGTSEDATAWLSRFTVPSGEQSTVAGYEAETIFVPPPSLADHRFRSEQLRHLLLQSSLKKA